MIETITARNAEKLDDVASELASIYIDAFARPPWNEVSRCQRCGEISSENIGTMCNVCKTERGAAYSEDQLHRQWLSLVEEGAIMEIASKDDTPLRITLAGLANPAELYERKYSDVLAMEAWLSNQLPEKFTYIYETFANLAVRPHGNLADRGQVLGRIGAAFAGLPIVTRTIQPAVVRATVRDLGTQTDVYIGEKRAGAEQAIGARTISSVPDWRTMLVVGAK